MIKIKEARVWKAGHSRVFTIPDYLFKVGLVDPNKIYSVTLKVVRRKYKDIELKDYSLSKFKKKNSRKEVQQKCLEEPTNK